MSLNKELISNQNIIIHATPETIWSYLTKPELIRLYLFGTETETTWQPNTPITFKGEYNGQSYTDNGIVLEFSPLKKISYSYWSSMSGLEPISENYAIVSFSLMAVSTGTELTVTQKGFKTIDNQRHSEQMWLQILKTIQELCENR